MSWDGFGAITFDVPVQGARVLGPIRVEEMDDPEQVAKTKPIMLEAYERMCKKRGVEPMPHEGVWGTLPQFPDVSP